MAVDVTYLNTDLARAPVRRLLAMARPLRPTLALAALTGALTVACGIALLGVSGFLIARASEHPNEVALAVAVVAVRAFGIGRGAFRYVERLSSHDAAFRVMADLRVSVYRRLERLVPAGIKGVRSGDLLTRVISDVDAVQDLFIRGITPLLVAGLVGAGTVIAVTAMFRPGAVAMVVGLLATGIAVPWLATRLANRADAQRAAARGALATALDDLISGAAELLAYGRAGDALDELDAKDQALTNIARRSASVSAISIGLTSAFTGATVWALLLLAVSAAHVGSLSRVGLAAVVLTGLAAFEATSPLAAAAQQLTSVRASARRVFDVLDEPDPVAVPPAPLDVPNGAVHLRVDAARMRYAGDAPWALDGIDVDLPAGRRVAIVGRSGSGKSSLATALVRFRDLDAGNVSIDGTTSARSSPDASPIHTSSTRRSARTSASHDPRPRKARWTRSPAGSSCLTGSSRCQPDGTPWWAPAAQRSPAANVNDSHWPARCLPTPRSSCSTSRLLIWIRRLATRCGATSSSPLQIDPSSSSLTSSSTLTWSTRSWSSRLGKSYNAEALPSCEAPRGLTGVSLKQVKGRSGASEGRPTLVTSPSEGDAGTERRSHLTALEWERRCEDLGRRRRGSSVCARFRVVRTDR
jgi:ATP-binding cassette subfamily C protein CydC